MAFTNIIPNFTIMAPKDFKELEDMLEFAVNLKKPVFIRYPRGTEQIKFEKHDKIEHGKCEVLEKGKDVCLVGIGKFVAKAHNVAQKLKENGISASVINARFLKPLDENVISQYMKNSRIVVSLEDGTSVGGLGEALEKIAFENKINCEILKIGYPDEFVKHGTCDEIERLYNVDEDSVVEQILILQEEININRRGSKCIKILEKNRKNQANEVY